MIRAEWGQALRLYEPTTLTPWTLEKENAVFLTQVGLPTTATDGGNLVIRFYAAEAFYSIQVGDLHGICIGETDAGVAVLLEAHTGHIWAGDDAGLTFINTSLEALLCCMAMYHREFVARPLSTEEDEPGTDDLPGTPATRARADHLRERLNAIDPLALDASTQGEDVSLWGYVVEEVEFGVI
ncbi:SUKH-4 family immunity protein [Deinococcus multiflagellatus]|uniref:SUKH-4 family immunity protein n=1 Tax=Deinococcus multiflagellatus TaxID=1656887 RepID=UPI001CCDB870|nr:SUKH-4 family immunity protein [Deinococcus multiflagellatus]MBZ9715742.1 SUKH-4 family immunity protein [Deinococcus multiflagellatus]